MKRAQKTSAEIRRANRGNVPGVLGMEEMAMLSGKTGCPECLSPFPNSHFGDCRIANGMKAPKEQP